MYYSGFAISFCNRKDKLHWSLVEEQFTQGLQRMAASFADPSDRYNDREQEFCMRPKSTWNGAVSVYWACRREAKFNLKYFLVHVSFEILNF